MKKRSHSFKSNRLLLLSMGMLLVLGIESSSFQMASVEIGKEFSLSETVIGQVIAVHYAAVMLLPPVFGKLGDRYGKKTVLLISLPMFTLGCFAIFFSQSAAAVLVAGFFITGGGYGVTEAMANAALVDQDPHATGRQLNMIQVFYSIGATLGPQLFSVFGRMGYSWRMMYLLCAVCYICIWPFLLKTPFLRHPDCTEMLQRPDTHKNWLAVSFRILPYALAMFCCTCMEIGVSYNLNTFLDELIAGGGALAVSVFWLFMGASQILFSTVKVKVEKVVCCCQIMQFLAVFLLSRVTQPVLAYPLVAAAGFAAGPIWSMLVYLATCSEPAATGIASGIMSAFGGLGAVVAPVLIGALVEQSSVRFSFSLLAFTALLGALLVAYKRHTINTIIVK